MKRIVVAIAVGALGACAHEAGPMRQPPAQAPTAQEKASEAALSPEQVRVVQRSLADRGFAVEPTGTFDYRTHEALSDFQRARGLPITGTLNPPTVDALGIDPQDVMPARGAAPTGEPPAEPDSSAKP